MDRTSILRAFNEHFSEFMSDVIRVFPSDNNLRACKVAIEQMRKANPKLLLTTFKQVFVNKYRQQISDDNIDFFINNDYSDDVGGTLKPSMILEKINMLRKPVGEMDVGDKEKTIKYIKNLMKLSDMYST
tara:strand:+ start:876 stop:1265 length:390 start_codon:yes stop_codon:yes gene_type:complete